MQCSQEPSPLQHYFWIFHLLPWAVHIFYIHLFTLRQLTSANWSGCIKKKKKKKILWSWVSSLDVTQTSMKSLGSKKRIQNFSLEVTLKIQTSFYVLGIQCFHASLLKCKKHLQEIKKNPSWFQYNWTLKFFFIYWVVL